LQISTGGPVPSLRHPAIDVPSALVTLNRVTAGNHYIAPINVAAWT
jgi:hypothetical protein